jgi:hypothetical protein
MPAEAQSVASRGAELDFEASLRDQERRRAILSPEEYEQWRQGRVRELIALTERMGKYAESQGMTDEVFAKLLAED